jgi:hypothetical protein
LISRASPGTPPRRNALPVAGCTIIGAGNATHAVSNDITGATRASQLESGCYDRP